MTLSTRYCADVARDVVGLFSSHANELRNVRGHLTEKALRLSEPHSVRHPRKKAQVRLSEARAQQVVSEYRRGKTVYQLSNAFGCHRTTISEILKRHNVILRGTSPTPEQADEMVRLYEDGMSLAKVGKQLGFNASTVLAQLRIQRVPTRTR